MYPRTQPLAKEINATRSDLCALGPASVPSGRLSEQISAGMGGDCHLRCQLRRLTAPAKDPG